jgi:sugar lactone lactonase YvrE
VRRSIIRKATGAAALVLAGAAIYLCVWPVPTEPVSWQAPMPPSYTGAHAQNTRLSGLRMINLGSESGPEHIAIGPDGKLYAAVASGNVLRMEPDGAKQEVFANTGGRVLGFAFDAQGRMIAADAVKGLLAITPDRRVTVLADHVTPSDPIRYADAVVVAPDGTIYLTDASRRFSPAQWGGTLEASVLDIMEQSATGRVLAHDPATGRTRIVAHGLSFANGIALSSNGHTLFVNETGRYRIWKIEGRATNLDVRSGSPQAKVLLDNLPGYPDNLMRGRDGRIWVGFAMPRNPAADKLARKPFFRKVTLRLPRFLWPIAKSYGHVFAIDEDGRVVADLQDPSGAYPETTGATETADRLYIQSLHSHSIGWMATAPTALEEIYILHSIREQQEPTANWCSSGRTGFEPFPTDAERFFSFWAVRTQPEDGRVIQARETRAAELRACFGPTSERVRSNFYAEIKLNSISFRGNGECLAVKTDFPEAGLFPVHCQLILGGLLPPYVGGLLTTNTIVSKAAYGGDTDPPGYTQASIATIRFWKSK